MARINKKLAERMKAKGYIPLAQAAELLNLTPQAVRNWLNSTPPKVAGMEVHSCWFVHVKSLIGHIGPQAAKVLGLTDTPTKTDQSDQ